MGTRYVFTQMIIDFIHVYGEEMEKFGDAIEWLPEEEARLI